ncbi:MAG: hypothetical protein JNK17_05560 [Hydrogenophaga sp.]|nr:hypothetical protein [Hydrogenophaga sp.]
MSRLDTEQQRLFSTDEHSRSAGLVRRMVLGISGPADWPLLGAVWRGVQADLDLPAPAIAVNGVDAFELWFSVADPLPAETAASFLDRLCDRYLPDLAASRRRMSPSPDPGLGTEPERVPQLRAETGRWSAFVAPDLAAVFGDDPSLDIPPGEDAQADLLSRIRPVTRAEFQIAMARLMPEPSPFLHEPVAAAPLRNAAPIAPRRGPTNGYDDPRQFLLDVMNDATVSMELRIQAAKALLP